MHSFIVRECRPRGQMSGTRSRERLVTCLAAPKRVGGSMLEHPHCD